MLQPVILSGGSGTRLWPASRETYPKQLLPLTGAESLLQITARRLEGFAAPVAAPIVVTNEDHRFIIAEQLRQIGKHSDRIVLEPVGRNTAPAVQLAALLAVQEGDDPVLLVMPADQIVTDSGAFLVALSEGLQLAAAGALVTFGIVPDRPETGYGYLRAGDPVMGAATARKLDAFVEKPDSVRAAEYVASGQYLWNAGIFMMRASVWLKALQTLQPEIAGACAAAMGEARRDSDFIRVGKAAFMACPSNSIDYAVMEKLGAHPELGASVVVPLEAGWSDVGAWDALWQVCAKDASGNAVQGEVMLEDTAGSLVFSQSRLVAAVGVKDLMIVETPDAVMVTDKARAQDVKKIVERIKKEDKKLAATHRKVYRPWGWYDSIDTGPRFQVKRIVVNPGATLSLQMHHHRAEHWIVVSGTAEVTNGEQVLLLSENQSTYIPLGTVHRLANPGKLPLEIIEVQSGSYLGEDDIVRFEDSYGRCK
ncbi:MAG: mannose-1-phosphate guanylyltransferase/mannose-6-phosphate isomerase [Candidatus Dactylopiibacterium carminicum]|uniref:mannose-1-phosphate guanylyltransferase n=1 Tax=Candidatus Dactylopiibacterium carminicum TaxID=857335 RepID=A0A272ERI5_9RHOO|nr:mannose-1-phosphate guanylyltransferase/mannose-6-phosphate isomerase [Candidatus Dactylopiibacterium carminicum]KAF7598823.1 mannose-1-phosphate guanylyltransferase/mannose-6-phosphate isomerase [Candidatus Dactylopiibacterium carminicum]PAS92721.1 MAG: mannose-1-phosphate guanylyltransferase/mannose-6-phosphate isomerase [Candidatus Dactylopiibacterium carminicum]PAS98844.1 MAG: mannose-1-phosphate guanylyltransferase/mannose-6-phosphate isomerase [Candidatus Dactylopiibacterium carminicum]